MAKYDFSSSSEEVEKTYSKSFGSLLRRDFLLAIFLPVLIVGIFLIVFVDGLNYRHLIEMKKSVVELGKNYAQEQYNVWKQLTDLQMQTLYNRTNREVNKFYPIISQTVSSFSQISKKSQTIDGLNKEQTRLQEDLIPSAQALLTKPGVKLDILTFMDKHYRVVLRSTNPDAFGDNLSPFIKESENDLGEAVKSVINTREPVFSIALYPREFFRNELTKDSVDIVSWAQKAGIKNMETGDTLSTILVFQIILPILDESRRITGVAIAARVINKNPYAVKVTYQQIASNSFFNFSMAIDGVNALGYSNTDEVETQVGYDIKKKNVLNVATFHEHEKDELGGFLTAYGPIENIAGKNIGTVRISTPYSNYSKSIDEQKRFMAQLFWVLPLSLFIALLIMIIIGIWWARKHSMKVTIAFNEITALIDNILNGNFDIRADISSHDELEEIGKRLNMMTERLSSLITSKREKEELSDAISDLLVVVSNAAKGNLTQYTKSTKGDLGELAMSFNSMVSDLSKLISGVKQVSTNIESYTESLVQSTKIVEKGMSKENEEIQNMVMEIKKLENATSFVIAESDGVSKMSEQVFSTIKSGGESIVRTTENIKKLTDQLGLSEQRIQSVTNSCNEIATLLTLIENFANQANLLSLNATIETARNPIYQSESAIIIDQIHELAERISKYTFDVKNLLGNIQRDVYGISTDIKSNYKEADLHSSMGEKSVVEFVNVIKYIQSNIKTIEKISTAYTNQKDAIKNLTNTINEVSMIGAETQKQTQQMMVLFVSLSEIVKRLSHNMQRFTVVESRSN